MDGSTLLSGVLTTSTVLVFVDGASEFSTTRGGAEEVSTAGSDVGADFLDEGAVAFVVGGDEGLVTVGCALVGGGPVVVVTFVVGGGPSVFGGTAFNRDVALTGSGRLPGGGLGAFVCCMAYGASLAVAAGFLPVGGGPGGRRGGADLAR